MQIFYINNDGGGFADQVELDEGTTISAFFEKEMGGERATDWLIRVNRQPCSQDQVLHEGDRVSITPKKIEGNCR